MAIAALAIALAAYGFGLGGGLEMDSVDARFEVRGEESPPEDIVLVHIDDVTFDELNLRFPFPRSVHGRLVDQLRKAGAKTIAYDVQFTEETKPAEDIALVKAVARMGEGVVLATTETTPTGGTRIFGGDEVLRQIGARPGNSLLDVDPGAVLRRLPYEVGGLQSFAVVAAEESEGHRITEEDMGGPNAWIDYHGPPSTFPAVSFSRALRGEVPADTFRDKTVVVGASAPSLQDVHPTPFTEELMAGPEVQANAIDTARRGFPLQSTPIGIDLFWIVFLGLVAPVANIRFSALRALGVALGAAALYVIAAQLAFNSGRILPILYPLLALGIGAVGSLGVQYVLAAFERQRVRDTFARFVPEPVVDEVLMQTGEDLRLGGEVKDATIFFSDIRGFTTFSEARDPGEVIRVLNRYLDEMSDAIQAHGGALLAYLGDGILAIFGAPLEQDDHADRAVAAARESLRRLDGFNDWVRSEGVGDGFQIGIGLNSGEVSVGQVGSEARVEYTAIGDVVNTASRLEGMTKDTEHHVFISEATRERLRDGGSTLEFVNEFPVRGRTEPIRVWTLAEDEVPAVVAPHQPSRSV